MRTLVDDFMALNSYTSAMKPSYNFLMDYKVYCSQHERFSLSSTIKYSMIDSYSASPTIYVTLLLV